ncbi:transcriptional regulator [Sporosarcina sp. NCCP-2716]|uniref:transcription repressor NadR n=1 Tax=Sporosarcina sp. NCCP-2716 TaxID=2943679 RepID=UPI00203AD554|nr:transcription repressor NadR [Sporosarcina sp. NCCP-2716]GKV67996.1 transcriptional regulator [Sporosarcina sp. NCCP-2716]
MAEKATVGELRRRKILELLKQAEAPLTGKEIGELTGVSRQVVVGDINLLKAVDEPIVATSRGYLYMMPAGAPGLTERIAVCRHGAGQTKEELTIFVDCGVTVKDVRVEHPVYGDLTASIMVSNRMEVKDFLEKVEASNAVYLSALSEDSTHLHTVSAEDPAQIDRAFSALRKAGILIE